MRQNITSYVYVVMIFTVIIIFIAIIIGMVIYIRPLNRKTNRIEKNKSGIEHGIFLNENNKKINVLLTERQEQLICAEYVDENASVLELGARFGTVSCVISNILKKKDDNKNRLVVVEPDIKVLKALSDNLKRNNCEAIIINKFIGDVPKNIVRKSYGTHLISASNDNNNNNDNLIKPVNIMQLQDLVGFKFDTLIADCERCLEEFIRHCIKYNVLQQFHTIIYEKDKPSICNYEYIDKQLLNIPNMVQLKKGFMNVFKVIKEY